ARSGAWFVAGDAKRVDLSRRGSLKRIFAALLHAQVRTPDVAVGHQTLLGHGWPNERLIADAASKRLRVAIAPLRSLGLRSLLLTRDDGYLLDPAARVRVEES